MSPLGYQYRCVVLFSLDSGHIQVFRSFFSNCRRGTARFIVKDESGDQVESSLREPVCLCHCSSVCPFVCLSDSLSLSFFVCFMSLIVRLSL